MGLFDSLKGFIPENLNDSVKAAQALGEATGLTSKKPAKETSVSLKASEQPSSGWSNELEEMVSMAIEDGELTDREIKLLASRAQREGVDPDEFEFKLRLRIRQHAKDVEKRKNMNPVVALSQAFSMLENYAKGGEKAVNGAALSGALALIPGVGQAAAVGGLLAEFIETPSNLNSLKAEAIRRFVLPDNPEYLLQFINYAASQQKEAIIKGDNDGFKAILSEMAFGGDLDIVPIWDQKIEEACDMASLRFPDDKALRLASKKHRPTLINKLRSGRKIDYTKISSAPKDDEELLEVVEFLYNRKDVDDDDNFWDEDIKPVYERFYKEAEQRFSSKPNLLQKLSRYKIKKKKFGFF